MTAPSEPISIRPRWRCAVATPLFAGLALASLAAYSRLTLGSVEAGFAYMRGERLIPDRHSKSVGRVESGKTLVVPFALTNHTGKELSILGGRSSCSCVEPANLPLTILPGRTAELRVGFRSGREKRRVSGWLSLYTNCPASCHIVLSVSGEVTPASTPESSDLKGGSNGLKPFAGCIWLVARRDPASRHRGHFRVCGAGRKNRCRQGVQSLGALPCSIDS